MLVGFTDAFRRIATNGNDRVKIRNTVPLLTALLATKYSTGKTIVEDYFNYWNERDMTSAIELFDVDCVYEDTLYPGVFQGKATLKNHLFSVAASLPVSFKFCLDVISEDIDGNVGVQWHVENDDKPLPFTRGCSMYKVNPNTMKIISGFDVPEPVAKSGAFSLFILKSASGFIEEPRKLIPFGAWVFYCWFLFISTVAPGPNALQLDSHTWQEVLDLSYNFWLILPIFFSKLDTDTISPVLEGIFNLLLAWAGLFAGFMVDGKQTKRIISREDEKVAENNFLVPAIIMQFLTNAAYLPYLFSRKPLVAASTVPTISFKSEPVFNFEDLTPLEKICESKALPLLFGSVGIIALYWFFFGRIDEGYADMASRTASFLDMMSTDRLGFSFVIDLLYFSLFQGWLIKDDLVRRGQSSQDANNSVLAKIGSSIPFFGLIYYLVQRPSFPKSV